jgi:flagellar biosynthesis protein FlhF
MNPGASPLTFRGRTTQAALEEVQRVLGNEAMIVSVRQLSPAEGHEVEVVALPAPGSEPVTGFEPAPVAPQPKRTPRRLDPGTSLATGLSNLSDQELNSILAHLASRIQSSGGSTANRPAAAELLPPNVASQNGREKPALHPESHRTAAAENGREIPAPLLDIRRRLTSQGLDPDLVKKLITTCTAALSPAALNDETRVRSHIRRQLEAHVRTAQLDALLNNAKGSLVVFLIGMSGAGKTSTCAKLAAHARVNLGKKVAWICADTLRTGAIAQARAYTEPMGIPLHLAYTPEELAQAVIEADTPETNLILVDTPSRNPHSKQDVVELGAFLTAVPDRVTLLVAPATLQENDLRQTQAAFGPFNLKGLILTKLDETTAFGNVFNLAWRSQAPVLCLTTGSRILEDLQPAQASGIAGLLFGERLARR